MSITAANEMTTVAICDERVNYKTHIMFQEIHLDFSDFSESDTTDDSEANEPDNFELDD